MSREELTERLGKAINSIADDLEHERSERQLLRCMKQLTREPKTKRPSGPKDTEESEKITSAVLDKYKRMFEILFENPRI